MAKTTKFMINLKKVRMNLTEINKIEKWHNLINGQSACEKFNSFMLEK